MATDTANSVIEALAKNANKKLNSSALKAYYKNALADMKGMVIVAVWQF